MSNHNERMDVLPIAKRLPSASMNIIFTPYEIAKLSMRYQQGEHDPVKMIYALTAYGWAAPTSHTKRVASTATLSLA